MELSALHKNVHRAYLLLAKGARHDGAKHAYFMQVAAQARFYFLQLRRLEK
jgi:hypothetical protein